MSETALAGRRIGADEQPFDWRLNRADFGNGAHYCLEVRPMDGAWKPFLAGVPIEERAKVVAILPGRPGSPPTSALVGNPIAGPTPDGRYFCWQVDNAATPEQSFFLYLTDPPTTVVFGKAGAGPQYQLEVRDIIASDEGEDDDDDKTSDDSEDS
jgi:hypothetical protein